MTNDSTWIGIDVTQGEGPEHHITLAYFGTKVDDRQAETLCLQFDGWVKEHWPPHGPPLVANVGGTAQFGPAQNIPVILLDVPSELYTKRHALVQLLCLWGEAEDGLRKLVVFAKNDYPWRPHITVDLEEFVNVDFTEKYLLKEVFLQHKGVRMVHASHGLY